GEQVGGGNGIGGGAGGIGGDAAVEGEGVLQGVELAFGERGNSAGEALRLASFSGRGLRQYRHDGETLSGLAAEGNRARAHPRGAAKTPRDARTMATSRIVASRLAQRGDGACAVRRGQA